MGKNSQFEAKIIGIQKDNEILTLKIQYLEEKIKNISSSEKSINLLNERLTIVERIMQALLTGMTENKTLPTKYLKNVKIGGDSTDDKGRTEQKRDKEQKQS